MNKGSHKHLLGWEPWSFHTSSTLPPSLTWDTITLTQTSTQEQGHVQTKLGGVGPGPWVRPIHNRGRPADSLDLPLQPFLSSLPSAKSFSLLVLHAPQSESTCIKIKQTWGGGGPLVPATTKPQHLHSPLKSVSSSVLHAPARDKIWVARTGAPWILLCHCPHFTCKPNPFRPRCCTHSNYKRANDLALRAARGSERLLRSLMDVIMIRPAPSPPAIAPPRPLGNDPNLRVSPPSAQLLLWQQQIIAVMMMNQGGAACARNTSS